MYTAYVVILPAQGFLSLLTFPPHVSVSSFRLVVSFSRKLFMNTESFRKKSRVMTILFTLNTDSVCILLLSVVVFHVGLIMIIILLHFSRKNGSKR